MSSNWSIYFYTEIYFTIVFKDSLQNCSKICIVSDLLLLGGSEAALDWETFEKKTF